jgi:hypothetical protein
MAVRQKQTASALEITGALHLYFFLLSITDIIAALLLEFGWYSFFFQILLQPSNYH